MSTPRLQRPARAEDQQAVNDALQYCQETKMLLDETVAAMRLVGNVGELFSRLKTCSENIRVAMLRLGA